MNTLLGYVLWPGNLTKCGGSPLLFEGRLIRPQDHTRVGGLQAVAESRCSGCSPARQSVSLSACARGRRPSVRLRRTAPWARQGAGPTRGKLLARPHAGWLVPYGLPKQPRWILRRIVGIHWTTRKAGEPSRRGHGPGRHIGRPELKTAGPVEYGKLSKAPSGCPADRYARPTLIAGRRESPGQTTKNSPP